MGVQKTTQQREELKRRNSTAAYAKKVNLMTPAQVQAEYDRVVAASQQTKRSKK